jgi:predicted ATPase
VAQPSLPTGTVTFLFSDIEGSTKIAQQFPEQWEPARARHHALIQQAMQAYNGYVFQIVGDAFCVAFQMATDAVSAAHLAQLLLSQEKWSLSPIRVRMGINTGIAQAGKTDAVSGGYTGYSALARTQRIMSAAHGGQILLSHSSAELVRDELSKGISLRDMGEHELKGLLRPEKLWQVVAPDLIQDFPPLETATVMPSNLPTPPNRFVGRAQQLEQVKQRLAQTRLLTLLGPGGTGKTRLALQAAKDLLADFENHVYFVDLASSRDSDAVLWAIGRTIGVRESSDKPLVNELKEQINHKKMLSLLDNFEQVTVAAPAMAELLRDCPELKLLVTSREALHVRGENVFPVPPLTLPPIESGNLSVEQLAQSEAVQLFVERAQTVKPNFALTKDNAPAVAEICARLDGLPLAIELATARLNVFTPQALAERLGDRLKLLRGGARDLPERQQTLRDTIDWSYELLDAREQDLFKLLALFSGTALEAVEAIASRIEGFAGFDVMEGVGSLVDKSLVRQQDEANGTSRLRMLETIREFATARLDEDSAFSASARRAHATFFAEFTASQWSNLTGENREQALTVLAVEVENIRTAWRFWANEGNLEQLNRFTDSLSVLYDARGWYHATVELTRDLLTILSNTVTTPDRVRQEILLQTSLARALLATKGYSEEVERAYARALELCSSAGEIPQLFPVLRGLASFYVLRGENDKGIQIGERILELAERLDDADMRGEAYLVLGTNMAALDIHAGLAHLEKAIAAFDPQHQPARRLRLGSNPLVVAQTASGLFLWMIGFPERARQHLGQAIALAQKLEHPFSRCYALFHQCFLNLWLENFQSVQSGARVLMDLAAEHGFQIWDAVGACLCGAAMVATGSIEEGLALIEPGMTAYRGLKTPPVFWPLLLSVQASAYGRASRPAEGLRFVNEAFEIGSMNPSKGFAPELLGLKGNLLLALDPNNAMQAESLFQLALNIARESKASMLELRAALKLARLWQAQGKTEQARVVLSEAYAKITERSSTVDILQARAMLKELP